MELFEELSWRVSDVSTLDIGTNFINEETIGQSNVYLNNFISYVPDIVPKTLVLKKPKNLYQKKSCLNINQHRQCLQALQLLESDRPFNSLSQKEQQCINLYNNLKTGIHSENIEFLKYVENLWNKNTKPTILHQKFRSFALAKRKQKLDSVKNYPEHYTADKMIPLSRNQNSIELIHEALLLELGVVGKLCLPNLEKNDNMYNNKLPSLKQNNFDEYIKSSVSEDIHAEFLAKQTACNIVISSSSLKTIIDNFGPDFKSSWDIPVIVKEHVVNGNKFNVVYVDKTLPQKKVSLHDLSYNTRKIVLKRVMCSEIAHTFATPRYIIDNFTAYQQTIENNSETSEHNYAAKQNTDTITIKSPVNQTNDDSSQTIECSTPKKRKIKTNEIESPIKTNDTNKITNENTTPTKIVTLITSKTTDSMSETNDSNSPNKQIKTNEIKQKTGEIGLSNEIIELSETNNKTNESDIPKKQIIETNAIDSPTVSETSDCDSNLSPKRQKNKPEIKSSPTGLLSKYLTRSATKKLTESSQSDLSEPELNSEKKVIEETFGDTESDKKNEENEIKQGIRTSKRWQKKTNVNGNQNVNYRLWKLKLKNEENILIKNNCVEKKEIKLIIRSKTDAYQILEQGQFFPTNIVPKLEYQVDHGGQILSKSELLRQWTTLYFRPFSDLLRVRISPKSNKYVKIDHIGLNKVTNECLKHYSFNPKDNLGVLFNVLSNMCDVSPGKYILRHGMTQGPFAALLRSVPDNWSNAVNLYDSYNLENCSISEFSKWIPIDTTLILSHHIKNGVMPGMFPPRIFGIKKKPKKKKNKTKNLNKKKLKKEGEIND